MVSATYSPLSEFWVGKVRGMIHNAFQTVLERDVNCHDIVPQGAEFIKTVE